MRRASLSSENARRALKALIGVAALSALACDNSMNFTAPTGPGWKFSEAGTRNLQIYGTLEAQGGACLEATVLYDGVEVAGARSLCPERPGCARLELKGTVPSATGHHTISFQVLRQSQAILDYVAQGSVLVSREALGLGGVTMRLAPTRASLGAGETVNFDVEFSD